MSVRHKERAHTRRIPTKAMLSRPARENPLRILLIRHPALSDTLHRERVGAVPAQTLPCGH